MSVVDQLQRPLRDLRISVTDRCNMRCGYCMPREVYGPGYAFMPRSELLSFEEIARVARAMCGHGAGKLRLTGGEPLLRRNLERLVEMLAGIDGMEEIALTTNGLLLGERARALAEAGLDRVTVSLDSLDPQTFRAMSDTRFSPQRVLSGIEAAVAAGLRPVKVNMVVRSGVNDGCVSAMAERFRFSGVVLRFIEYMDVGTTNGWRRAEVVEGSEILATLAARWPLEALAPAREGEVANRYRYLDGAGEIGLIQSVSKPFCGDCTRARLTADGQLFTCLFARRGHDLRALLRAGASERELAERIGSIWSTRADRYSQERAKRHEDAEEKVEMSYIGG